MPPTRARPRFLVTCLLFLAASCARTLDARGLEDQLSADLGTRFPDSTWQVACPDDIERDDGSTFRCTATDDSGDSIDLEITQDEGGDGVNVTWRVVGAGG